MVTPNAKICPRCGKVVPVQYGVCDYCARLFRTPIDGVSPENRTMMFHHLPLSVSTALTPAPKRKAAKLPLPCRLAFLGPLWQRLMYFRGRVKKTAKTPPTTLKRRG